MSSKISPKRVMVYIDGYNLLNAIKSLFGKKYYRTNYKKLAQQYLAPNEKLTLVYYFSALYFVDMAGVALHKVFINALHTFRVKTILGKYQLVTKRIGRKNIFQSIIPKSVYNAITSVLKTANPFHINYETYEEKRTDVNMAVQIVSDGLQNKYDKAIIITGDSDIVPAIDTVKHFDSTKEFVAVIPIGQHGNTIKNACDYDLQMIEQHLINSQLPQIVKSGSKRFIKPKGWN